LAKTEKVHSNRLRLQLLKLFEYLDSDCDGEISAKMVCISAVPRGIIKIM